MRYLRPLMSCVGTLAALLSGAAFAQATGDFPAKPVTMIIPSNPGGPSDFEVRLYAPVMSALMGQQFIVDYKFGAGSIIGTSYVAKAPPDGYTLLMTTSSFTATPSVNKNLPFDIIKDFAPLSLVSQKPLVLMVRSDFPAKTFREYIAYAKANPGKVNFAMTGPGSTAHFAGSWMHNATSTTVTYVPYKGMPPMVTDIAAGRSDVTVPILSLALPLVKEGRMRLLAVLNKDRIKLMPDLPTIAEQGIPDYDYVNWTGYVVPAATPAPIVDKLADALIKTVKNPEVVAAMEKVGNVTVGTTPAQFRQIIATESARWRKLAAEAGIKGED